MTTSSIPPITKKKYNQNISGFFGKFGTGAKSQIYFLQCGLRPIDLNKTTLISDIHGSECWPVRDLFQRDVDIYRVTNSILPYFMDKDKVKFFNPLTLTLLPIDQKNNSILSEIPKLIVKKVNEEGSEWLTYEADGLYRFKHIAKNPEYGVIEWNDSLVKIVAIDGQHRLSALKRYFNDTKNSNEKIDFLSWTIPVVIFGLDRLSEERLEADVLDVIRNVFIYINTTAQTPNRARQILLNDESIVDICTQEILDYAHSNDIKKAEERERNRVPLLFFDWRGEQKGNEKRASPTAIKKIEEINDWLYSYILFEDFSPEQEIALGIQPINSLYKAFNSKKIDAKSSKELRELFKIDPLKGITYIIENFLPYKKYIEWLRDLEDSYMNKSDVARHAFYRLRFGNDRASDDIKKDVDEIYLDIVHEITSKKFKMIPQILQKDIGMRAIICAFGELKIFYEETKGETTDWYTYSKWFTGVINVIFKDDWFDEDNIEKWDLHLHLTHDHSDTTVNYRLEDSKNAFGAFICLLVAFYGNKKDKIPNKIVLEKICEEYIERIFSPLLRGYKKEVRPQLRPEFPFGGKPLNQAVSSEGHKKTQAHLDKLEGYFRSL